MAEIDKQMKNLNFIADHLFVTAANMTQAGCELGARALNWSTRIQGISPVYWDMNIKEDIARIYNQGAKMLDLNLEFNSNMINIGCIIDFKNISNRQQSFYLLKQKRENYQSDRRFVELEFPIIFFNHHLNCINDIGKNVTIRDTPLSPQGVCVAPIILF